MEALIYIAFFVLFITCGYLVYQHIHLEKKIKDQEKSQKKAIADAGNAITDTLRVAFDNIKRHGSEINKLSGKHTEYQSRIHRLEQTMQQILASRGKNGTIRQREEIKK